MKTDLSFFIVCCKGNVVIGDVIVFTERVQKGRGYYDRKIVGKVLKDSYGEKKEQHTFTIFVIDCDDNYPIVGSIIQRKGRVVYGRNPKRQVWQDELKRSRVKQEKNKRGDLARKNRDTRKSKPKDILKFHDDYF